METDALKLTLSARIEARLFSEGRAVPLAKLARTLNVSLAELMEGLEALRGKLSGSGIALVSTETEVTLAVSPPYSRELEESRKAELDRDIGDAGLEVLSIVLYRGPSTRADIDYVRGVNSSSTVRTLLERGLVERAQNPKDAREFLYRPTADMLAHLGVTRAEELPDHATIAAELAAYETERGASGVFEESHDESGNTGEGA